MDPVCMHSPFKDKVQAIAEHDAVTPGQEAVYRTFQGALKETV
jgi:hypothetical protein